MKVIAKKSAGDAVLAGSLLFLFMFGTVTMLIFFSRTSEPPELYEAFLCFSGIVGTVVCLVCLIAVKRLPKVLISLDDNNNLVLYNGRVIPLACVFNVTAENYRAGRNGAFKRASGKIILDVADGLSCQNFIHDDVKREMRHICNKVKIRHVAFCQEVKVKITDLALQVRNGQKASLPESYDFY